MEFVSREVGEPPPVTNSDDGVLVPTTALEISTTPDEGISQEKAVYSVDMDVDAVNGQK